MVIYCWHWDGNLYGHWLGLPADKPFQFTRVIVEKCSWNGRPLRWQVTLWGEVKSLLLQSSGEEPFKLVELNLEDDFEIANTQLLHWGRLHSHCWFILGPWNICLCGEPDKYIFCRDQDYDHSRKWFSKVKHNTSLIHWSSRIFVFILNKKMHLTYRGYPNH